MSKENLLYVREKLEPQERPPENNAGIWAWAKANLLATPMNTIFTILAILLLWWFVPPLIRWLFVDAVWTG